MTSIILRSVSRRYRNNGEVLTILDQADLAILPGAFAVVCGPSGSGKSTLLNMIGALDKPDDGDITIGGIDVVRLNQRKLAEFRNRKIGFVFQSFHLLPVLTAAENVAWPLYFQGLARRDRMRIAREKLALVGLADHANKRPSKLSGGQRQRVAIARALVCSPAIVLADEPTANLDRKTAQEILAVMVNLNADHGVTFFCATHDQLVMDHARELITLTEGKLHLRAAPGFNPVVRRV